MVNSEFEAAEIFSGFILNLSHSHIIIGLPNYMKPYVVILCMFFTITAQAQKQFGLAVSTNFDFAATGFGTNDAGIGLSLSPSFFAKSKLQLRTEWSLD